MSLRYVLAGLALLAGIILYQQVNADKPTIKVKVTPAPGPDYVDDQIVPAGAFDNGDGTVTLQVKACGAFLEFVAPSAMILDNDPRLIKTITDQIDKACANK